MPAVIDQPTASEPIDRFGFVVAGWVWLPDRQSQIAAVGVWHNGQSLGQTEQLVVRPDVCRALEIPGDSQTGFEFLAAVAHVPRGQALQLELRCTFRDGTTSEALCSSIFPTLGAAESDAATPAEAPVHFATAPNPPEVYPPEHLQVRQVAAVWNQHFYKEGRVIMSQVVRGFARAGQSLADAENILDFGCGCGRVLRAFGQFPHRGQIWGCDIDREAIAWSRANLGEIARFETIPAMPPTEFAAGQFDAIYAISVFTHLPEEIQFAWLTELRRILRPGGLLLASLHGGGYWTAADLTLRREIVDRGFAYRTGQATEGLPNYYMTAFHSERYVRSKWTRFFELVSYRERFIHGVHDAAMLRRPLS